MTSPRPWPFDDDDRPSGSVQPLSQADLQAILAHLGDDPDELLAGTRADRPVVAIRVRATVGRPGGSAQARWRRLRAAEWVAWTRTLPWRAAVTVGVGAVGGLLANLIQPRMSLIVAGLAATVASWGLRFRPSSDAVAWRRGAAGERRTARLLAPLERQGWVVLHDLALPWQPGQPRSSGDRSRRGVRDRFQAVSGPAAARRRWEAVAWPLSPCPRLAGGVLGGRPGRPGPARPGHGRGADHGRPRRPGPLGQGRHRRRAHRVGPTPAKHAWPAPGHAGTRAGRLAGRPGPGSLPRRRLTGNARRILHWWRWKSSLPCLVGCAPGGGRDGQPPVSPGGGEDGPSARAGLLASSTARLGPPDVPMARVLEPCASSWTDAYVCHWHTSHRPEELLPMGCPLEGELSPEPQPIGSLGGSGPSRPSEALRAGDTSACLGSWRTFSRCHLHGIWMPLCRAFDFGSA
jgi:hypothetical protein